MALLLFEFRMKHGYEYLDSLGKKLKLADYFLPFGKDFQILSTFLDRFSGASAK